MTGDGCGVASGSAISGVAFGPTSGTNYPAAYRGALYFSDYTPRCIWMVPAAADGNPDFTRRQQFVTEAADPVELQIGTGGDLFYVELDDGRHPPDHLCRQRQPASGRGGAGHPDDRAPLRSPWPSTAASRPTPKAARSPTPGTSTTTARSTTPPLVNPTQVFAHAGHLHRAPPGDRQPGRHRGRARSSSPRATPRPRPSSTPLCCPPAWSVGDPISFSGHASRRAAGHPARLGAVAGRCSCTTASTLSSCHIHTSRPSAGVSSGTVPARRTTSTPRTSSCSSPPPTPVG